ncbi:MAG: SdrD B-like domain-containing protein [Deltaproteobacteria bacterium]
MNFLIQNYRNRLKSNLNVIATFLFICSFFITGLEYSIAQATISGAVWHDINGNGEQTGEPLMSGFTVELRNDGSGTLVNSATTGPGGTYSFNSIPVGIYYIRFVINAPNIITPSGFGTPTTDCDVTGANPGTGPGSTNDITITGTENITDIDAGYYIYAIVGDRVWHDQDADGIQDGGEPGIGGIVVNLTGLSGTNGNVNLNATTNAVGNYQFNTIPPGTNYTISFDPGATYQITYRDETIEDNDSDPDPANGDVTNISLISEDDITDIDCGLYIFGTIGNLTWHDTNGNGLQDGGEPGIGGVDVTLNGTTGNGTPVTETATSDGTGNYQFSSVIPGNYTLTFDLPAGYTRTYDNQGANDNIDSDPDETTGITAAITIVSDQDVNNIDAGYFVFSEISGQTWHDLNGDSFKAGEPTIDGISVTLTGTSGNGTPYNESRITAGGGNYLFDNVPPGTNFMLHFDPNPAPYDALTNPTATGDSYPDPVTGNTNTFNVQSNQLYEDIDAGYIQYINVGDFVWEDMNGNGLQDAGEPGVANVTVQLGRASDNSLLATTVTDGNGNYLFDDADEVRPGEIFVAFFPPAGYAIIDQNAGADNIDNDADPATGWTEDFTVESGDETLDWDAGIFRPPTIGDQCWRDQNTNGLQDAGEFVFPNVEVRLIRASDGTEVDFALTDGNGQYQFGPDPDIKPGEYFIRFGIPATFQLTVPDAGDDLIDSDPDPISGETPTILFESGDIDFSIDAGYFVEPPQDCFDPTVGNCQEAEVLCELAELNEFCTSMVSAWQQTPIPGCGSGYAFHNPSWFAFVAGSTDIYLIIHASNCVSGGGNIGIQWGIYDDCDLQNGIILQCPCVDPGDIDVYLNNLTVGQTYYFFIDGCSGTMCTYWIEIVSGGGIPEVTGPLGYECGTEFPDCEDICVGGDVTFILQDVYNAVNYEWNINGNIIETTDPEITTQFDSEGTFEVCVKGLNACDEGEEFCFPVTVISLPPEDLGIFEVCENDLSAGFDPPGWLGGTLTTEGTHTADLQNGQGCAYEQIVQIIKLPIEQQVIDTIGCTNVDMIIEGETFTTNVSNYEIIVPNGGTNGCNKRILATINFLDIDGYVDVACSGIADRPVRLNFYLSLLLGSPSISVQWFRDGIPISDDDSNIYDINVNENGTYSIEITLTRDETTCIFDVFNTVFVDIESFFPNAPVAVDWQQSICSNSNSYIPYTISGTDPAFTYIWTWPSDVYAANLSTDGTILTVNWFGSQGGNVCVYARDPFCGNSDTICYPVQVFAAPSSAFTLNDTICLTATDLVTYTGTGTSNANFTWNFSGGTETSGTGGEGIGPHTIKWDSPGQKVVSLEVMENGCLSGYLEQFVEVVPPPSLPVITCTSTATSVTFEWDNVTGATGTQVILVSGDPGTQNGNTYSVTGLNPLEQVVIQLQVQTNGICPGFITNPDTCRAQDCPLVAVNSFPVDTSICFNGSNPAFKLRKDINPAGAGVITWIGNGIVDATTGLFDPKVAGIGNHTITLKYDFSECTYTDKTTIRVLEQPTANFNINKDTVCIKDAALINYTGNAPTGTPTWNFNGGSVISGSGLSPHSVKWNSSGLKNVQLSVENNGCISNLVSVPILVQDTLGDIFINCSPSVNDVSFSWNTDPLAESYKVFINGIEVSNSLINSWNVAGLNPGDKVDITVVALNKGVCGSKSSSFSCEARECPTYTIDISPDINEVCLDANTQPIQFTAVVTSSDGSTGGTSKWSGPGINQTSGLFDPKIAGPGTHTIKYDFKGICDASANFKITVIERPAAQFTVEDDVICITDTIVVNFFSGNPSGTVYNWNIDGGTRKNINASKFTLKWNQPGTYEISLSTDNKGCKSTEVKKTVTVEPKLALPILNCINATTNSVGISWNDIDCATNYRVLVNGSEVANSTNLSYNVQNLGSNTSVNFTVEAISDCSCGNVQISKTCKTEPCPSVALSIQNLPEHLCSEFAKTLKLGVNITGPQNGTLNWTGPGIAPDGTINFTGLGTGKFVYKLQYSLENCNYNAKDSILITPEPVFQLSKLDPLCHNEENGQITASPLTGVQYSLAGEVSPNGIFTGLQSGNYTVLGRDSYGCESIESIDLINPPAIEPGITGNVIIKENQKNTFELINVSNINISNIVWSLIDGGVLTQGPENKTVNFGIEKDDTLCVEVFDENDCSATACLAVTFLENIDIDIPNIFTPDGDGRNDVFYVKGDRSVEAIKEMRIFDRWGELVFFQENAPVNDINYGWNGEYKGKKLNPGVYVYYIVFKLKEREDMKMVGDLTIVR